MPAIHELAFQIFFYSSFVVLALMIFGRITAPYGKHVSSAWGSWTLPDRWGWVLMESPSSIIFLVYLLLNRETLTKETIILFVIWQIHYFYRSFIYPFKAPNKKRMPVALMMSALIFQLVNTYFQASWVYIYAPKDLYASGYLTSWHFIVGVVVFFIGTFINRQSDNILRSLKKPGETEYKIPYGGMFRFVSCPNYLGEMTIWLGWAIMLWSPVGLAFFYWTVANLAPRAFSSHKWYKEKFADYPKDRKALIPFIL
ncbi:MAG: DUF1295 domain-containing protein [Brevinema sp.]